MGVRSAGRSVVYSTANPFIIHARVLLETGEGSYRVVDGSMTNCKSAPSGLAVAGAQDRCLRRIRDHEEYRIQAGSESRSSICPICGIRWTKTAARAASSFPSWATIPCAGTPSAKQYYWAINRSMDSNGGNRIFQQARVGAERRLPLQGSWAGSHNRELASADRPRRAHHPDDGTTGRPIRAGEPGWRGHPGAGAEGFLAGNAPRRQRRVSVQLHLPACRSTTIIGRR